MTDKNKEQAEKFMAENFDQVEKLVSEGATPFEAFEAVMRARLAVLAELVENKTERAQRARKAISDRVWDLVRA